MSRLLLLDARETVLSVARHHRWVRETQGSNRGEVVDRIVRESGLDPAGRFAWCACFVAYIGRMVLAYPPRRWPLKPWAGCVSLAQEADQLGLLRTEPAWGGVFLQWRALQEGGRTVERFAHTGFLGLPVTGRPGWWETIEGNTSPDGSREGTGVFIRERRFHHRDRFIWWWDRPATPP
jgi:hypothetical protein